MNTLKSAVIIVICLLGVFLLTTVSPVVTTLPEVHTVEISQMQFKPETLSVNKGDTVVFINKDIVTHDVTEISGKSWKSPALASGDSWQMVVTKNQAYFCSYHPVMKGKILVE